MSKENEKVPTKEEIKEYMELHNADEVGVDNQWTLEDAEYHLLLSDMYHNEQKQYDFEVTIKFTQSVYATSEENAREELADTFASEYNLDCLADDEVKLINVN